MMTERLVNTSQEAFDHSFPSPVQKKWIKPRGVWYSLDQEWMQWVKRQKPELEREHFFRLEVDERQILQLNTREGTDAFYKEFGNTENPDLIDWPKVAGKWAGIEISGEALSGLDQRPAWLISWDVNSGCIWDASAISGSRKLDNPPGHGSNVSSHR